MKTHQKDLINFFNGTLFPKDKKRSFLYMLIPLNIRLRYSLKQLEIVYKIDNETTNRILNLKIGSYNKENPFVIKMSNFLNRNLSNDLIGAYVHGSLGVCEEIPYSDFDALVILKDEIFLNKKRVAKVAKKLCKAMKIMYEMDPLQHHGWFILTESDLKNYPQTYFPYELFQYAKSLFPDRGSNLQISFNPEDQDHKKSFINLANSIIKKIESGKLPKNIYHLKGLLSEFMLLPALYVQARDKKGVFKKHSFDMAKKDFSNKDWEIMDEVSKIRKHWHYKISFIQRRLLLIINPLLRKIITKYFSPRIPKDIKSKLTPEFYDSISTMCKVMVNKI